MTVNPDLITRGAVLPAGINRMSTQSNGVRV
jgi:hypothetical protein